MPAPKGKEDVSISRPKGISYETRRERGSLQTAFLRIRVPVEDSDRGGRRGPPGFPRDRRRHRNWRNLEPHGVSRWSRYHEETGSCLDRWTDLRENVVVRDRDDEVLKIRRRGLLRRESGQGVVPEGNIFFLAWPKRRHWKWRRASSKVLRRSSTPFDITFVQIRRIVHTMPSFNDPLF